MRPKHIVFTCILVVAAFGVGWLVQKKPESNDRAPAERKPIARAPREIEPALRPAPRPAPAAPPVSAVADPEKTHAARPPAEDPDAPASGDAEPVVPEGPVTDDEIKAAIATFGKSLQSLIVSDPKGAAAADELRDLLARATPEQMENLVASFGDDTVPAGERILLAHALAQSEQPEAIAALQDALREPESGLMVQRFAAHSLAFSDADGLDTFMLDMARNHAERGVRANLAFGLQRRGVDEGVGLYFAATDEALENGDPSALRYVGGLALIDDRANPGIRERLGTYEGTESLLVLIQIVQRRADRGAIPALEKLAYDASRPISVQKAAQGVLKILAEKEGTDAQ